MRMFPRFGLILTLVSTLGLMSVLSATTAYAADYTTHEEYHSLKACAVYCWEWHTKVAVDVKRNQGNNTIYAVWVDCSDTGGFGTDVQVTWCGVAGDSTRSYLDVGENWKLTWNVGGIPISANCWQRIHLYPDGWTRYFPSTCAWQSLVGQ
jgi:hypothetical protein